MISQVVVPQETSNTPSTTPLHILQEYKDWANKIFCCENKHKIGVTLAGKKKNRHALRNRNIWFFFSYAVAYRNGSKNIVVRENKNGYPQLVRKNDKIQIHHPLGNTLDDSIVQEVTEENHPKAQQLTSKYLRGELSKASLLKLTEKYGRVYHA